MTSTPVTICIILSVENLQIPAAPAYSTHDAAEQVHRFVVVASNAAESGSPGLSTTASVTLIVVDVNEHAPEIEFLQSPVYVSSGLARGRPVTRIIARDDDINNARHFFRLRGKQRAWNISRLQP